MNTATQRRLSHDLRGSLANLRIGLQACRETPELFVQLSEALLEEVERLDRRLLQLSWMARCAEPQRQECNLQALLSGWAQELGLPPVECPALRVTLDPDLFRAAFEQVCHNAQRHAGGVAEVRVTASDLLWELQVCDRGAGWPEGLPAWLSRDIELWHGQIALGLPLVQKVLNSHAGSLQMDQPPLRWTVPRGGV